MITHKIGANDIIVIVYSYKTIELQHIECFIQYYCVHACA